jgi:hypothetical protein
LFRRSDDQTHGSAIDRYTVILIVHLGTANRHAGRLANIKAIRVVTTLGISIGIVDGHIGHVKSIAIVNANSLNRSVGNMQIDDGRISQIMSVEELWLRLASVRAFTIPPARAVRVERSTICALDCDRRPFDLEERAIPLFVFPGGLAFEYNLLHSLSGFFDLSMPILKMQTVVPSFKSDRSRVVPAGTLIPERTIVEHEP